ncbi:hypothetical protein DFH09DRAFT_905817 [Mycena vulgaris]|nr:hypothetical protein DFH09DRAFT_905817 [Mycena vulgaris]
MYDQFWKNIINHGKNAFSMRHIALADSFPGITIDPSLNWAKRTYLYTRRVFEAQSLKPAAWVTPMRQEFLDQYIKLNNTLTHHRDSSRLLVLTVKPYQDEALALARRQLPGYRYKWNFHREVSPTRIISLRAADGNFDKKMPETGTRVAVQALVRFDTEQSVEIYDRQGNAVHTPALTAEPQPVRVGKALNVVPAERKRVTEYLVLDKQMHELDAQWRFRARYVPTPGRTVAV